MQAEMSWRRIADWHISEPTFVLRWVVGEGWGGAESARRERERERDCNAISKPVPWQSMGWVRSVLWATKGVFMYRVSHDLHGRLTSCSKFTSY